MSDTQNTTCENIVQLLDDFVHAGPNGYHQCLVFELLGPTVNVMVDDEYEADERLDVEIVIRITVQLLQSIEFIHNAGFAHGGTFKQIFFTSNTSDVI